MFGKISQSHSTLNMFRNAQDAKSNLILTTLSYMDYYAPRFGYFENVPGFLRYALNADQVDVHTTRGGVQSGGLKLFVRSLLDMQYVYSSLFLFFSFFLSNTGVYEAIKSVLVNYKQAIMGHHNDVSDSLLWLQRRGKYCLTSRNLPMISQKTKHWKSKSGSATDCISSCLLGSQMALHTTHLWALRTLSWICRALIGEFNIMIFCQTTAFLITS